MARASVKSPDAFRTISEAADALDLPQHVLRFWETRFSQIKPMKRSGGRRYYRPSDIALLQGIRHLLYDEGYTIKGVQRILREQGIAHVTSMGEGLSAAQPAPAVAEAPTPIMPPAGHPQPAPTSPPPVNASPRTDPVRAALNPSTTQAPAQEVATATAEPVTPPVSPGPMPQQGVASPPTQNLPQPPSPSLRFVREPQPEVPTHLQPTPDAQPHAEPAPEPAAPPLEQPVSQPQMVSQPNLVVEPGTLCSHQTETLATALRTLMDCKAMLDQAKSMSQNPASGTASTEGQS